MKEIIGILVPLGIAMMIAGGFMAYTAYGHSNAIVQWIHHLFATGMFGIGVLAFFLGPLVREAVGNGKY